MADRHAYKFNLARRARAAAYTLPTLALLYILVLALGFTVRSQQSRSPAETSATGHVVDSTNRPLPGARVVARNITTGLELGASTDATGRFFFTVIGAGDYEVTASAPGFAPAATRWSSVSGVELEVTLDPASLTAEVVVQSAARQDELRESLSTKVDVVGQTQIRDTGYEAVGEVLREVPGVVTRRGSETSGGAGEQVQGIDSRQVLVLQDGQPVLGARGIKSGTINLDRQSIGRLERIEVVKGASSALYGSDAIGGVINLISSEPKLPFAGSITTSGGNPGVFDTRGEIGFVRGRWLGMISLERHKSNGIDLTPTTFDTTGAGFHRYDGFAKLKYQVTPALALTQSFSGYWNNAQGRSVGETGNQLDDIDEESQSYSLNADWQIDGRTSVQARGYFSRFDEITRSHLASAPFTELPGNLFERYGKLDATISRIVGARQLIQAGGEWTRDSYRGINRLRGDRKYQTDTSVFWAQDKISVNNRLTLTLGGRFDHHSVFGSAVSPKFGLNIRMTDGLRLRASWGRGFRAPDLGQLYYRFLNPTSIYQVLGNPSLSPEHAGSWQLGGEYTTRARRVRLGLNLFRNDVRNLISSKNLGFIVSAAQRDAIFQHENLDQSLLPFVAFNRLLFVYENQANIATEGVEADGDVRITKGFVVSGAYTYLNAFDKNTDLILTNRNRHQGTIRLAYDNQRLGLRANLRGAFYSNWLVSRATSAGVTREASADGFQLWDMYAAKRLPRGVEAFAAVDNVLNNQDRNTGLTDAQRNPLPLYRTEAGRTFRVGVRWTFSREK